MNDSDRILAAGVPITLTDGTTANVRFGLLAVKHLEDQHGSIGAFMEFLNAAFKTDEASMPTGKAFSLTWELLQLGLRRLKLSDDDLDEVLDPARLTEYVDAVTKALKQGLNSGAPDPKATETGTNHSTNHSPGRSSTTSPRPRAVAAIPNSGT